MIRRKVSRESELYVATSSFDSESGEVHGQYLVTDSGFSMILILILYEQNVNGRHSLRYICTYVFLLSYR